MAYANATYASGGNGSAACPPIDDFRRQVYSVSYSLISVFGLLGNVLVLVVLGRSRGRTLPFHVYMTNLAVSDLLCVAMLPLRVTYYARRGQWRYGDLLCRLSSYSLYVNLYCSIYFMSAMSVSRFLAVVFPVQNLRLVTVKCARLVCVCIWVFICSLASPCLLKGQHLDPGTNKTKCFEPPQGRHLEGLLALNYLSLVVGFALPLLVILLCYVGIIWTLLYRQGSFRGQRGTDRRAIRTIAIILLTFLVSFAPYHVQRSVHLSFLSRADATCSEQTAMQKSVVVALCLAAANSCMDPLLYFFSSEGLRRCRSVARRSQVSSSSGGGGGGGGGSTSRPDRDRLRPPQLLLSTLNQ